MYFTLKSSNIFKYTNSNIIKMIELNIKQLQTEEFLVQLAMPTFLSKAAMQHESKKIGNFSSKFKFQGMMP